MHPVAVDLQQVADDRQAARPGKLVKPAQLRLCHKLVYS